MIALENETLQSLVSELKLNAEQLPTHIQALATSDSKYLRDLRINLKNALAFSHLTRKESLMIAFSVAVNDRTQDFAEALETLAKEEGVTAEELAEVRACVSLLNVNNVFYRFRHFTQKDYYQQTPAGIKMGVMMNPLLGKEFFELLSLAISALNGCELCVNAHEHSLIQLGTSEARVYDAVRCAAIFRGMTVLV
jgi:alkyl hydroperoxide reductase subunit D